MRRDPLVTVLTPVYNGEPYLVECIESVLAQTYENWDYVIVNNQSTDRSREIADRYARKESRIRVMDTPRFLDVMASQNTAFRQVSPEASYCKMVHADDWLFPDCVRRMVDLAEAHPSVGIVGAYRLENTVVNCDGLPFPSTVVPGRELARAALRGAPSVFGSPTALLYRAELVLARERFFDESDFHADAAVCYEILRTFDFGFVHQVLTFARKHPATQSTFTEAMKTYLPLRLRHLQAYGPFFLGPQETASCLRNQLDLYYRSVTNGILEGRGRKFVAYHRQQLETLGYRLSWLRLAARIILEARVALVYPVRAIRAVARLLRRSRR